MIEENSGNSIDGGNSIAGRPSMLSCPIAVAPDGTRGPLLRFRCHVGHAYSPASLVEAQGEAFEQALWMALRTHNERIKLFSRMKESADPGKPDGRQMVRSHERGPGACRPAANLL